MENLCTVDCKWLSRSSSALLNSLTHLLYSNLSLLNEWPEDYEEEQEGRLSENEKTSNPFSK